ncbi:MAG: inositol monophosphatase [Pseudomonadota bacterium]
MTDRRNSAEAFARAGGALALSYFRDVADLAVEDKGPQDFVTEADKAVEALIREKIEASFPGDGIVGEEHAPKPSLSGYTWVIDPIDGTANFISSIPAWTVVLAVVSQDEIGVGVIFDPVHDALFLAGKGEGAFLNGVPLVCAPAKITRGNIGVGHTKHLAPERAALVVERILASGGVFYRNASGALTLAYVAAGRLIGHIEAHMNAWDCLAGQLLVAEAGGQIETQSANDMIAHGGRVVAGASGVFEVLVEIADEAF